MNRTFYGKVNESGFEHMDLSLESVDSFSHASMLIAWILICTPLMY